LAGTGFLLKINFMNSRLQIVKLYLEIISLTVVSIGGLTITYFQYKTAKQELLIHQIQVMPLIKIETDTILDGRTNRYITESLTISNEGEPVKDFSCSTSTYITVEREGSNMFIEKCLLLKDYFQEPEAKNNYKGLLAEQSSYANYKNYHELFLKVQSSNEMDKLLLSKFFVIEAKYKDILNNEHEEYFMLRSGKQSKKISKDEAELISSKSRNKGISEIRPDDIYDLVREYDTWQ